MTYSPRLPTQDYLDDSRWIHLLAEHLHHGSLALVVGAGVSVGKGLPTWSELVRRCLDDATVPYDPAHLAGNPSSERLGLYIDRVERKYKKRSEYQAIVTEALYRNVKLGMDICQDPLLIALGALLMGSRRGSVREVVTFNFDVVLEYYLGLHGYSIQSYDQLPQLRTAADVRIAHINGILPHPAYPIASSGELIFSARSMQNRIGTSLDVWKEFFRDLLNSYLVLFVGVSGSDPIMFPILTAIGDQLTSERVTGVWLFGYDIDADPNSVYQKEDFMNRNLVPVCQPTYESIPERLLEVCQEAARRVK